MQSQTHQEIQYLLLHRNFINLNTALNELRTLSFSKEHIQMANKCMKRFSRSLIIKEMQIKTTIRYYFAPVRRAIIENKNKTKQKNRKKVSARMWRNWNPVYTVGGTVTIWRKTVQRFVKKFKIELPYYPATLIFLGIYTKELKTEPQRNTCTLKFTAALFTIAKRCKKHEYPSINEWIKKTQYIHTMEYYSALKKGNPVIYYNIAEPREHSVM